MVDGKLVWDFRFFLYITSHELMHSAGFKPILTDFIKLDTEPYGAPFQQRQRGD